MMRTESHHIATHHIPTHHSPTYHSPATLPLAVLPPPRPSRSAMKRREASVEDEMTSTSELTIAGVTFTFRSNLKGYDRNALDCVRSVLPRDACPSGVRSMPQTVPQKAQRTYDMIVGGGDLQVTIDGHRHRASLSRAWDLITDDVKSTLARCSTSHAAFRAAAVWVENEALLLVGRPGSGTSRLARAFERLGYPLLAEELVLVQPDPPRVAGCRIGAVIEASYKPDAPTMIRESGSLLDRLLPEGASPEHLKIATEICLEARTLFMLRGEADEAVQKLLSALRGPFRPS